MKKFLAVLLAMMMILTACTSALALDYKATQGNPASFETMTEALANEAAVMKAAYGREYMAHPAMAAFPGDTAYVYRSADMYGVNGATRINTNMVVYTDKVFESKDAALAYLKDLGVTDMVDSVRGSVVLVTPANGTAFGTADQANYVALQTAMFSIGAAATIDGVRTTYADAYYYGGYGYYYVIGIDGGATFLNNYIAGTVDTVSRIAGMLLIGGDMYRHVNVAAYVPTYLVNAEADVVAKYEEANTVNAVTLMTDRKVAYNQEFPARKVISRQIADPDLKAIAQDAWETLFLKSLRGQEMPNGTSSAGVPYNNYTGDQAPYSLHVRNAMIDNRTADGIVRFDIKDDRYADIKTAKGEYLQTWYEYIPEEVLNGEVKEQSVPMILVLHGGGDDPTQYIEGQGYIELAGAERIIMVAPEKGSLHATDENGKTVLDQVLPLLVKDMLAKYPAIDPSRVYVTGYSMGCLASFLAMYGEPTLFAAAYPQAGIAGGAPTEEQAARFADVNLPVIVSTSENDSPKNIENKEHIVDEFYELISIFKQLNGLEPLPAADWDAYPMSGFAADIYTQTTMNGEHVKHTWMFTDDNGVPMVGLTFVEDIVHCLYPSYAEMVWDFVKCYSRDQATGEIVYNPYVD